MTIFTKRDRAHTNREVLKKMVKEVDEKGDWHNFNSGI